MGCWAGLLDIRMRMKKGGSSSMVTRRSITAAPMATVSSSPSVESHLSTRMIVSAVDIAWGGARSHRSSHQDSAN